MSSAQIDTLRIRAPGADRDQGERLGRLVAQRLAPSLELGPGESSLERLRVELAARPGETPEDLAGRIAAQVALLVGNQTVLEAGR